MKTFADLIGVDFEDFEEIKGEYMVQDIIDWADRVYPNKISTSDKVVDLDMLHKEVFLDIKRLTNDYTMAEIETVNGQLLYDLPDNCSSINILSITLSSSETIDYNTEWNVVNKSTIVDDISVGYYYSIAPRGLIAISIDGQPVSTDGLYIRIYYYKNPTTLVYTTDIPDLKSLYINILKYKLVQMIASQGDNPDNEVANYWQSKSEEELLKINSHLKDELNADGVEPKQIEEFW